MNEIIKQLKEYLKKEVVNKKDPIREFSDETIKLAMQKLSANVTDVVQSEEDPVVIAEVIKSFLSTLKLVDERDLPKQQMLIKLFEQLNKHEQSRYY